MFKYKTIDSACRCCGVRIVESIRTVKGDNGFEYQIHDVRDGLCFDCLGIEELDGKFIRFEQSIVPDNQGLLP